MTRVLSTRRCHWPIKGPDQALRTMLTGIDHFAELAADLDQWIGLKPRLT
jgi:hypothetical protein